MVIFVFFEFSVLNMLSFQNMNQVAFNGTAHNFLVVFIDLFCPPFCSFFIQWSAMHTYKRITQFITIVVPSSVWHHIVMEWSHNNIECYVKNLPHSMLLRLFWWTTIFWSGLSKNKKIWDASKIFWKKLFVNKFDT